jgi:hypothetical protein
MAADTALYQAKHNRPAPHPRRSAPPGPPPRHGHVATVATRAPHLLP